MYNPIVLMERNKAVGFFGISYLDKKLNCIQKNDLILIGARSGAGKSSLAQLIAIHNNRLGKKVSLFSLENFDGDDFMQRLYYEYMREVGDYSINQRAFSSGNMTINKEALGVATYKTEKYFDNLDLVARQKDFTIDKLKDELVRAVEERQRELIILDHLDYIDKDNQNESDVSHVSEIMRTIRNLQDAFGVAVIAFSHLRKPQSTKDRPAVPSIDEFIGSSNKVKEATAVIMLAPDDKGNQTVAGSSKRFTWCCVRKLRQGGIDNKTARLIYDTKTGLYDDYFEEKVVSYNGEIKNETI